MALKALKNTFRYGGVILPQTMANLAYYLWFRPSRFSMPPSEKALANIAKTDTLDFQGEKIRVWRWGSQGPRVLFMHGWSGRGAQVAPFAKRLLESGFQIVSFDGPAHGQSTGKNTNIFFYAKVTQKITDTFGPIDAVLTHSFGAMVYALSHRPCVGLKKAVLIAPPATLHTPINHFKETLALPDKAAEAFNSKLIKNYGEDIYQQVATQKNIGKLKATGLVIHDMHDNVVPWKEGEAICNHWPDSELFVTKQLGHHRILSNKSVIKTVVQFFNEKNTTP